MLIAPPTVRVFLCLEVTDMRKGHDGLAAMTEQVIEEDPLSGHLFVFRNRRGNRIKVLFWDRGGFALFYKRLEKGTFRFPEEKGKSAEIEAGELGLILEGIDLRGAKRRPRMEVGKSPVLR